MINIDSSFYFVGNYRDTNEIEPDSSFICKVGFDRLNNVIQTSMDNRIKVFPNPFTNQLRVIINEGIISNFEIIIYSVLGKRVLTSVNNLTINTQGLPSGTYFLELKNRDKILRQRIVKY